MIINSRNITLVPDKDPRSKLKVTFTPPDNVKIEAFDESDIPIEFNIFTKEMLEFMKQIGNMIV